MIFVAPKMEQQEAKENSTSTSTLAVIPRLDRIDRLLQFLEEKRCSGRNQCPAAGSAVPRNLPGPEKFKTLSSALEEVHHRGTLMERVAMLENRVLQLSLEMDESGSSTSSIADPVRTMTKQVEGSAEACLTNPAGGFVKRRRRQKAISPIKHHRKWLSWFQMGC